MLELKAVTRAFEGVSVLNGINVTLRDGEILCLLGPSGCGKTTLLRIIAGLEKADGGSLLDDGRDIQPVPTHQRGFGLMFQDFALFPHMDVAANVAFGLRMHNLPAADQKIRVTEMLNLVGLVGFDHRDVTHLSGGERQRVALARSLAPNPRLLMLDEPLGSLDAALREDLIVELRSIIKKLQLTAIYVTHDQHEAYAIADRIAVMNAGRIEQVASPESLYRRPTTAFVARFVGLDNVVPVLDTENGFATTVVGTFAVPETVPEILLHTDYLHVNQTGSHDGVSMTVEQRVFQGDFYRLRLRHTSGTVLTAKYPSSEKVVPQVGDAVSLQITPEAVIALPN